MVDLEAFVVIVEIDENQHRGYNPECDASRWEEIWEDLRCRPMRVIRFNPDAYTDEYGEDHPSAFRYNRLHKLVENTRTNEIEVRESALVAAFERALNPDIEWTVREERLFYDFQ